MTMVRLRRAMALVCSRAGRRGLRRHPRKRHRRCAIVGGSGLLPGSTLSLSR
jgi:hypothetical protein